MSPQRGGKCAKNFILHKMFQRIEIKALFVKIFNSEDIFLPRNGHDVLTHREDQWFSTFLLLRPIFSVKKILHLQNL